VAIVLLVSVLYRFGPSHVNKRWRWITPGSLFAGIAWLLVSLLFSLYVNNFGSYDKTYGSLGAAVGFMTWIWLSLTVVLAGAELNCELER
jgi:membrane protein